MTESLPLLPSQGILFVLSGPSGVGKGTVLRDALPRLGAIRTSISVTTRLPRPEETPGVDYFFISPAEFARLRKDGGLLEHAHVHGHSYGTPRAWVTDQLNSGTDIVLEIDVQGALQVQTLFPQAILVFLAPPSMSELSKRLHDRNTEDDASIALRLNGARQEMMRIDRYDYLIINDLLDQAIERLCAVMLAERCRPYRQDLNALLAEEMRHE